MTPNDPYDYDSVAENVLVDVTLGGQTQKLALNADRNGFAYANDRTNGRFLWAVPFVKKVTWTKGIDPKSGKPVEYDPKLDVQKYNPAVTPSRENTVTDICPGNMGGKNWPPTAYNPDLRLWYIPVIESCNRITVEPDGPRPVVQAARVLHWRRAEPARAHHGQRHRNRRHHRQGCGQARDPLPDARRSARDTRSGVRRRAFR